MKKAFVDLVPEFFYLGIEVILKRSLICDKKGIRNSTVEFLIFLIERE
jgi:hypothetical protein